LLSNGDSTIQLISAEYLKNFTASPRLLIKSVTSIETFNNFIDSLFFCLLFGVPQFVGDENQQSDEAGQRTNQPDHPDTERIIRTVAKSGKDTGEYPRTQRPACFSDDPQKEKYRRLMGEGIFRLSVGIENADDIVEDLRQALNKVP